MSAGPVGRREVAVRCFAAEYDDADLSYSESDEERAPNYVVTPTGARINRLFVVGVLTEVESVSDDVLRARVVDPTGAFVVYAGQYQPDAKTALERLEPPTFVAVTGKARTFEPDDGDRIYTSIRPESIGEVDAATRDRWTVQAAEQTLERVSACAAALEREERSDALEALLVDAGIDGPLAAGIPRALDHYGTTGGYLVAVRELALQAAAVVAGERQEVDPLALAPDEGGPADVDLAGDLELGSAGMAPAGEEDEEPPESAAVQPTATDEPPEPAGTQTEDSTPEEPTYDETEATGPAAADAEEEPLGDFEETGASAAAEPDADVDAGPVAADATTGVGEEPEFELDEEEIEAVEEEFGTEFSTGNEVEAAGEADIDPPEPAGDAGNEATATDAEVAAAEPTETATDPAEPSDAEAAPAESADESDLVDAAVDAMADHDEGGGAERSAVIDAVMAAHGVDRAAVESAIDTALMEGRCYEPDDEHLKAI